MDFTVASCTGLPNQISIIMCILGYIASYHSISMQHTTVDPLIRVPDSPAISSPKLYTVYYITIVNFWYTF